MTSGQENQSDENDVFILRNYEDDISKLERIGTLVEKRSEDGELLLMDLNPLPSEWDDLQGSNILYLRKKEDGLYCWIDFSGYAGECENWEELDWPEGACQEIDLESDNAAPGLERGILQRVLEDSERTIALVRQREPIQTHTERNGRWDVRNEVRPERRARSFGAALSSNVKSIPLPNCDFSVQTTALKKAILSFQTTLDDTDFNVTLSPADDGIELSIDALQRKSHKLKGRGEWNRRIAVPAAILLFHASKGANPNIRLTYVAKRLFLDQVNVSAMETQL